MSLNKIKISFDPTNIWDNNFFREFIKTLVNDVDNYEVFLITTNIDTPFLNNVITEANIDISNVSQVSNNTAVVARITTLKSLIHLVNDNVLVNFINSTIPIQLVPNNVVGCQALILNNIIDTYLSQPKWVTQFDFWQKQIEKQYNSNVC